jgi:transcriptional regulator with XRE-family HTH domain
VGKIDSVDPMASLWHWLAYDLRKYRERAGMTQVQVARVLRVQKQSVNNYERGDRRISEEQARTLDDLWETGGHFVRLLRYARLGHDPDWFKAHLDLEHDADELRIFELSVVPGVMQTESYARKLHQHAGAENPESDVKLRMERQQRIFGRKNPPLVWVLLDEQVIRRPIGSATVMKDQLALLLNYSRQSNVTVQIVPLSAGFYVGLEGSFKIITVRGVEYAYTEAAEGGRLARDVSDLRSFKLRYDRIWCHAWPVSITDRMIKRTVESL